jgi:hypothetical protein
MTLPASFISGMAFVVAPLICITLGAVVGIAAVRSRPHSVTLGFLGLFAIGVAVFGARVFLSWLDLDHSGNPLNWGWPALEGLAAGVIVGTTLALVCWTGRRFSVSTKACWRLGTVVGIAGLTGALSWTAHLWVSQAKPYFAQEQSFDDAAEAARGRGPFVATPSRQLIDHIFPRPGQRADVIRAEWATLTYRFRNGTLAPDDWRELLSRDLAFRHFLRTRKRVAPGAPVWAEFPSWRGDLIGNTGREWSVIVDAQLPDAIPLVLHGHAPWPPPGGPQLLGRAPESGESFSVSFTIDEMGGQLHTTQVIEIPMAVDRALSRTLEPIATDEATEWMRQNVSIRFDAGGSRGSLCAKRTRRTMDGVVNDGLGIGFRADFVHRGQVIAHSYGYALHFTNPDAEEVRFVIVGDTRALAEASLTDPEWKVHISGDSDWAMADLEATHFWLGEYVVPVATLAAE